MVVSIEMDAAPKIQRQMAIFQGFSSMLWLTDEMIARATHVRSRALRFALIRNA